MPHKHIAFFLIRGIIITLNSFLEGTMNNSVKYYLHVVFGGIYNMVLTGSLLQTFMLENGYSEESTNIFFSVMNIIQVLSILALTGMASRVKKTRIWMRNLYLLAIPFAITLALMCFIPIRGNAVTAVLYLFGMLFNVFTGVHGVLSYKLPYTIMDMKDYGKLMALSGSISGAICFGLSTLLSFCLGTFEYMSVMKISYIISVIIIIASMLVMSSFRENGLSEKTTSSAEKTNILKYKPFTYLIIPNLTRGFCLGMVTMAVTIGYYHKCIDSFSASVIVVITNAMTILGCLVYSKISGVIKDRRILLFSSIAVFIFMPLMVLRGKTIDYLVFYTIVYFFITIINYAVPVTVTKIADYDIIGQYSAGRMLLNTLGTSIAGLVCVWLFERIGVLVTITLSGGLQLLSGVGYYVYLKYYQKLKNGKDI